MLDSLTWHVMDATADDWESLEQILPHVNRYHGPTAPAVVAELISRLVGEGLMEEMQHPTVEPSAVVAHPMEFWFRMTAQGRTIWDSEGSRFIGEEA